MILAENESGTGGPSGQFIAAVVGKFAEVLEEEPSVNIQARHIATIIHRAGKIWGKCRGDRIRIRSRVLQHCVEQLGRCGDVLAQHNDNALYGMGGLGASPGLQGQCSAAVLQGCVEQLGRSRDVDAQALANALYGLLLMSQLSSLEQNTLSECIDQFIRLRETWSDENISQIAQVISVCGRQLPDKIRNALIQQKPNPSKDQMDLKSNIEALKLALTIKNEVLIGGWFVDSLLTRGQQRLVIELDGNQHYVHGLLRAEDQRRDEWLKAQGYEVIRYRIPYKIDEIVNDVRTWDKKHQQKVGASRYALFGGVEQRENEENPMQLKKMPTL